MQYKINRINYPFSPTPSKAITDPNLSDKAKRLLDLLILLSRKHGYVYASDEYLSNKLHYSESTIQRCLKELEKLGYIKRVTEYDKKLGKSQRKIYMLYDNFTSSDTQDDARTGANPMLDNEQQYIKSKQEENTYSDVTSWYGPTKNIPLTNEEYDRLIELMGIDIFNTIITKLSIRIAAKGRRYDNYYYAVLDEYCSNRYLDSAGSVRARTNHIQRMLKEDTED